MTSTSLAGKSITVPIADSKLSSVVGVNLADPHSAPRAIKTWDDRLNEDGIESGVDDEVCQALRSHAPWEVSVSESQ